MCPCLDCHVCLLTHALQMDETVINGAQTFYIVDFGIGPGQGNDSQNQWIQGLVNSAPYVSALPQFL